ncbi:MAG: hypothetical protein QF389_09940, partial [Planctomycetota bacterium]|nr:hypothetical protein [Planctomycetota bacterium]
PLSCRRGQVHYGHVSVFALCAPQDCGAHSNEQSRSTLTVTSGVAGADRRRMAMAVCAFLL